MAVVDATFRDVRARLEREASTSLEPLVQRMVRDFEGRMNGGLHPVVDVGHWAGRLASVLADIGSDTVDDIGRRVTVALGGIVDERDRAQKWNGRKGTANYIFEVARAMAEGELGSVAAYIESRPYGLTRREIIRQAYVYLEATGANMVDVAANFAAYDAGERAGATTKRWQVNSSNPRSSHAAINGQERPFSEDFSNQMPYPRGPSPAGAAAVANCKCSLVILKEDS
jgi:hypothetical protein